LDEMHLLSQGAEIGLSGRWAQVVAATAMPQATVADISSPMSRGCPDFCV
jgi:hypothetical protein